MLTQIRGKNVAIAGTIFQVIFVTVMLGLWLTTDSYSAMSGAWFLAGGLAIWLMVGVLFYVRQLHRREAMELEELSAQPGGAGSIFQAETQIARSAAVRAQWMDRWAVPGFTLVWAAYNALAGVMVLRWLVQRSGAEISNPQVGAMFTAFMMFLSFLISRYAIGMASQADWRLLRSAGSYVFICCLVFAAVTIAMLGAHFNFGTRSLNIDTVVARVIPVVMILLAVELVLNFILDIYRPRVAVLEYRPSFDSRIFNLIADPGRIGHSVAEALNYQFGFEVSKTWFYQLLAKAFVPMLFVAGAILLAMTGVLVVREGESCVVLRLGRADPMRATLGAGLHFVWPWPIDTIHRFETGKIHTLLLGAGEVRTAQQREAEIITHGTFEGRELALWTQEHGARKELDFLLAIPPERTNAGDADEIRPPVNIIRLIVLVKYRIVDPYKFGYTVANAHQMLEMSAHNEMIQYLAGATLDSPIGPRESNRPEAIMTYGRQRAASELKNRIQKAADQKDLGVEIVYVGLPVVHPPPEAAEAFQEVLRAERRQDELRYKAEAQANETLAKVAGEPDAALRLAMAINMLEELERLANLPRSSAEFNKALKDAIQYAREELELLEAEIARERLLGQTARSRLELSRLARSRLGELERISADAASYDLDARLAEVRRFADELFRSAAGEPAAMEAEALTYRWSRELNERARSEAFEKQLTAYQASPNIYMLDRWLDVWDETLPNISKYVLGVDREKVELWLNWEKERGVMESAVFPARD